LPGKGLSPRVSRGVFRSPFKREESRNALFESGMAGNGAALPRLPLGESATLLHLRDRLGL